MSQRDKGRRTAEAERYKKAATDALTQLDWCIQYLADNHQGKIAGQLARNRNRIGERLRAASRS